MEEFFSTLDDKLAKLPFNGNKLSISLAIKLALPLLAAQFPPLVALLPVLDPLIDLAIAISGTHKAVKVAKDKLSKK